MRKLAREATIFALLGLLVATIGVFVNLDMHDRANARQAACWAVHAVMDNSDAHNTPGIVLRPGYEDGKPVVPLTVKVPLTNGTVLHIRPCDEGPNPNLPAGFVFDQDDCKHFSDPFDGRSSVWPPASVPLGNADQVAIEKDYWAAYNANRNIGWRTILGSLFFGLWGFPAGLGLWMFYRLVWFAVKG